MTLLTMRWCVLTNKIYSNRNDWFAIKIFKTDHNDNEEKAKTDMKMLEAKVPHMIPCLDTFKIKSRYKPNHSHLCLVMSASGPTLGSFVSANLLSFDERRLLAINVTKILNKMHKNDVILNGEHYQYTCQIGALHDCKMVLTRGRSERFQFLAANFRPEKIFRKSATREIGQMRIRAYIHPRGINQTTQACANMDI